MSLGIRLGQFLWVSSISSSISALDFRFFSLQSQDKEIAHKIESLIYSRNAPYYGS